MAAIDYASLYDNYWSRPDRLDHDAYDGDLDGIKRNLLALCRIGKVLDVGCGRGKLVRALLDEGVDANGVDVSGIAVAQASAGAPGKFSVGNVTEKLPFLDSSVDTIVCTHVIEHIDETHLPCALAELRRVTKSHLFIILATNAGSANTWRRTVRGRDWWHDQFLRAGFRTHPLSALIFSSRAWRTQDWRATFLLEKIPDDALAADPLESLRIERDLHMDMTREGGGRADAHVERYHVAARFVREGDTVLDAACGLGYGAYVLFAHGRADHVVGLDLSEGSVAYAGRHFSRPGGKVQFQVADLGKPLPFPDASFDVIASFETLEHLPDPELFLAEAHRILRPGGRVVVSVPNDWTDETGTDPNPYHFHVYDWTKLRAQMTKRFVIDAAFAQVAGGGMKLTHHTRRLNHVDPQAIPSTEAEWWLMVGVKSPLESSLPAYQDQAFAPEGTPKPAIVDFGAAYDNPWLVKSLVVVGWRFNSPVELDRLARSVLETADEASADRGAALCVRAYQFLSFHPEVDEITPLISAISTYLDVTEGRINPHVRRWRISLLYVVGRLWGAAGLTGPADEAFRQCAALGADLPFALLATKTVDAWRRLGLSAWARSDIATARSCFRSGIVEARRAIKTADWRETWGDPDYPLRFGFDEVAEICRTAKASAEMLRDLNANGEDAGAFGLAPVRNYAVPPETAELTQGIGQLLSWNTDLRREAQDKQKVLEESQRQVNDFRGAAHESAAEIGLLKSENAVLRKKSRGVVRTVVSNAARHLRRAGRHLRGADRPPIAEQPAGRDLLREINLEPIWNKNRSAYDLHLDESRYNDQLKNGIAPGATAPYVLYLRSKPEATKRPRVLHVIPNVFVGGSTQLIIDLIERTSDRFEHHVVTSALWPQGRHVGMSIDLVPTPNVEELRTVVERFQPDLAHVHYWGLGDDPWYTAAFRALENQHCRVVENVNTPIAPMRHHRVDHYVYVSAYVQDTFGKNADAAEIASIIHPGIDLSAFGSVTPLPEALNTVGMVYRLETDKLHPDAIDVFIEIVKRRPRTRVDIIGGGSLLPSFIEQTYAKAVRNNFRFTGYVPYADLPRWYDRFGMFIAPVRQESFGQVAPFAMLKSCVVAGYKVGALGEILGDDAFLTEDTSALAASIVDLLENPEQLQAIGERNRERAREKFDVEVMVSKYRELYDRLLS